MNPKETSKAKASKKWRTYVKRVVWMTAVAVVAAGVAVAVMPKPIDVETAPVEKGELVVTVDEDGTSRVRDRYIVSAPLGGNLARIELHTGDTVEQGQVLARILPMAAPLMDTRSRSEAEARVNAALAGLRQSSAQIERAKATADYAAEEAKRTKNLVESGAVSSRELTRAELDARSSQAELTSAEFSAKVARHQLAMAQAALGRLSAGDKEAEQFEVTSPIAGRVLKVIQQSEGVVQAGTQLLEIGDPEALEVAVDVLTSDAVHVRPGAPVTLENWGGEPLKATVRLIEPSAFTRVSALGVEEQRVNAILAISSPYEKWELLGDGYRVESRIETYRNPEAVKIPWSALYRRGSDWAVFVKDGTVARSKKVEIGRRSESHVEVLTGLSPGQHVIVHPSDKLRDGSEITSSLEAGAN